MAPKRKPGKETDSAKSKTDQKALDSSAAKKQIESALLESEKKYHDIFMANPDAILLFDEKTLQYIDVNPAALKLYGYSRSEFSAMTHLDITNQPETVRTSIQQLTRDGINLIPLRYHRKKDKTVFPVEIAACHIMLTNRRAICSIVRDITERKKDEEALKKSEERWHRLFEQSNDAIFLHIDDKIIDVNAAASALLGYSREQFLRMTIEDLLPEAHRPYSHAAVQKLSAEGSLRRDAVFKKADGNKIPVEINARLINPETGLMQGVVRDISERKKAEEFLRHQQEHLEKLVQERTARLSSANKRLEEEIARRDQAEQDIEKKNTALKEILAQIETEKLEIRKQVTANAEKLLMPVVSELRRLATPREQHYVELLEQNIRDLTSRFGVDLGKGMITLTPRQVEICNMIRNGMTSKEIAEVMGIAPRTVETHRHAIRKKLGINQQETNLGSYLQNLE